MARRYARDGLGRFASGGGGGGRSSGGATGGGGAAGRKKKAAAPVAAAPKKKHPGPPPPAWSKEMLAAKAKSDKASKSTTTAKPVLRGSGRVKQPSRATYRGTDKEGMAIFGSAKKPKTYKIPPNTPKTRLDSVVAKRKAGFKGVIERQNRQLMNQSKKPIKWR